MIRTFLALVGLYVVADKISEYYTRSSLLEHAAEIFTEYQLSQLPQQQQETDETPTDPRKILESLKKGNLAAFLS